MKHIEMIIDYITDGTDFQYNDNHGVLVRCKDCKHRSKSGLCKMWSVFGTVTTDDDMYCSYGEREDGEQNEI